MKRRESYEEERRRTERYASTLVIAAAIIAAVRLAREDVGIRSPRVAAAIGDSVNLAKWILERVVAR